MKRYGLIPALALMLGVALGHALRRQSGPPTALRVDGSASSAFRSQGRSSAAPRSVAGPPASDSLDACRSRSRSGRISALTNLYATLDSSGFAREASRLAELPIDERFLASFLLYGRWAETDPAAALASLNALGKMGEPFLPVLLQCWANTDPAAAAAYYQAHPERFKALLDMGGGDAAAHIASEWARNDPAAALAWAESLSGDGKDAALGSVVRELADSDPVTAWTLVSSLTPERRVDSYAEIARAWGAIDFAAAERQIAALTALPANAQQGLRAAAVIGLAKLDPKLAADKITAMPTGNARNDAVWTVVTGYLAERDAAAAARWIMADSKPVAVADQLARVMPNFVNQDAVAARSFVETLPPGRVRDWAICRFALEAMRQGKGSYEELSTMTDRIADPEVHTWAKDWLQLARPK